jgi:hypothetical protein
MQRIVHTPLPQQPDPVVHLAPIASGAGIDRLNRTVRHDGRGSAQAVDFDPAEPGAQEPGVGQVCAAQVGIAQGCELEIHTVQFAPAKEQSRKWARRPLAPVRSA